MSSTNFVFEGQITKMPRPLLAYGTRDQADFVFATGTSNYFNPAIPPDERWAWNNPDIRASFERSRQDLEEGRIIEVNNLESFLESL